MKSKKFSPICLTAVASLFIFSGILMGCGPRGETHTLEQVLDDSRVEYKSAVQSKSAASLTPDIRQTLEGVTQALESMLKENPSDTIRQNAGQVADGLSTLVSAAGYTSRPSFGELMTQFEVLADRYDPAKNSNSELKLLVSRVYGALASELEGVKFALKDRELKQ